MYGKNSLIYCQLKVDKVGEKQRQKLKHISPSQAFLPDSASLLTLLPPSSQVVQGDGELRLQPVHKILSLPLLPPHALPTVAVWGPSHGIQTSPACILPTDCISARTVSAWLLSTVYEEQTVSEWVLHRLEFLQGACGLSMEKRKESNLMKINKGKGRSCTWGGITPYTSTG